MEQIFVTFLVVFALFFANSTTVLVALVAKPLVLPTQWSHLQKIVHKPLESDLNFSKTLLQCSNVTVSCVKYHFRLVVARTCTKYKCIKYVGLGSDYSICICTIIFMTIIYNNGLVFYATNSYITTL